MAQPLQSVVRARIPELVPVWVDVPGMPGVSVLRTSPRLGSGPRIAVSDRTSRAIAAAWGAELPSPELLDYVHRHPDTVRVVLPWRSSVETPEAFSARIDSALKGADPTRPVSGAGKAWIAGDSSRNYGWYHPQATLRSVTGLPLYQSVGGRHNADHHDYSQQLHLVRYAPGASRAIPSVPRETLTQPVTTSVGQTGTFAADRAAVIAALNAVLGRPPTIGETAYLHAVTQFETGLGRNWTTAAGKTSNNTGSVMLSTVGRYGLSQADFPLPLRSNLGTTAHEMTPDGQGFAYLDGRPLEWRFFQRYPTLADGLRHNAKTLYVDSNAHPNRHVTLERAAARDLRGAVWAQKSAGYYEAAPEDYLSAVTKVLRGWAVAGYGDPFGVLGGSAPSTPPSTPPPSTPPTRRTGAAALAVGLVVTAGVAAAGVAAPHLLARALA